MTNGNSKAQLPRTATMPMPPKPTPANGPGPEAYGQRGHNSFLTSALHEDVGRTMQSIIDLQAEVNQLRKQNMDWERRALLAEGKVEQQKQDMLDVRDDHMKDTVALRTQYENDISRVQRELDYFKTRDATVQTKLAIGAQHFLDCISAVERDRKDQESKVLTGMDAEITKALEDANKPIQGD